MKKILIFLFLSALCFSSKAQVDIELRGNAPNLEVWILTNNFISGDFINGITFTITWPTACAGVDISNSPVSGLAALGMSTSGGTVVSGSNKYKVFNGAGGPGYDYSATNNVFVKIMTVAVTGTPGSCPFSIDPVPPAPVMEGNWGVDGIYLGVIGNTSNMTGQIIGTSAILPIELLSFKATKNSEKTALQWETIREKNLSTYIIERSNNGVNFKPIGTEKPKGTNEDEKSYYTFIDEKPDLGINYYRLKSKDLDESVNYSKVVSVAFALGLKSKAYPNPFIGELSVEIDIEQNITGDVIIDLFDMTGKQVLTKKIIAEGKKLNFNLPTADLIPGTYLIRIKNGNLNWQHQITKQ